MKKCLVVMAATFLFAGSDGLAQERALEEADLPRWVEEDVINFFNDPTTIHFTGRTRIPSTRVVLGDVAALGGPFTIAGEVDGDLVMVNGDVVFETGGSVTGNVLIVGGRVLGEDLGNIGGNLRVFAEPLRYVQRGERIAAAGPPRDRAGFGPDFSWGDARFTIKAGQNYNRIEGLPIMFGPAVRTAGPNPTRLDLFAIWRTEMGVDLGEEDFGYALRAEQALGGRNRIAVGGTFYSFVQPIEDWGLSNLEASLASFILHRDYRDYYDRTGWSAYARLRFPFLPVELRVEYFDEEHEFTRVSRPWSLTKNNDPWRAQPLVAEGDVRSLEGTFTVDTRNQPNNPSDGWYARARVRRGLGGDFAIPEHREMNELQGALIEAQSFDTDFLMGFLDLRSYNRINPRSSLNLRGMFGGAMNDVPLPPQYQHALGGEGSMPGYRLFSNDCGAREAIRGYDVRVGEEAFRDGVFGSYGCDRFALFQAEIRSSLFLDWSFGWDEDEDPWEGDWNWYPNIELSPDWAAFFDMGKAWSIDGEDSTMLMDVGVGLYLGDLGMYYAFPLNEDKNGEHHGNFFIRLTRRF